MNYAIIGCGRVAPKHAKAIKELPNVDLVAVCDCVPSRADHFAKEYQATPYTDYRDLLQRKDIDIVSVCVPSGLHAEIGQEVAKAGKHLLVEKPIALSLEDADALITLVSGN
ncbi:MAG: Gfo/Idh/MocA family oxidoreductase [Chloroflexota bacterium]|nr:Gfo/Idh/MocA family oxidoreductase [Chloroflexota bacterium]